MESLRRVSPIKKKRKAKKGQGKGSAEEDDETGGHMGSLVMALLSSQAGDTNQAVKHLNASRIKEVEEESRVQMKATVHDSLAGPPRGQLGMGPPRASDFIFDGEVQHQQQGGRGLSLPPASSKRNHNNNNLDPLPKFSDKHDTLIGAFFARDASESADDIFRESDLQFKPKGLDLSHANAPRADGTINGLPILHDVSQAAKQSAHYRWTNKIANTSAISPKKVPKNYMLVEESKLEELSRFESTLSQEARIIAGNNYGSSREMMTMNMSVGESSRSMIEEDKNNNNIDMLSIADGESKVGANVPSDADAEDCTEVVEVDADGRRVGQQLAAKILNHDMVDPRVPTGRVVKALKKMNSKQKRMLIEQWDALTKNWVKHAADHHYNKTSDQAYLFNKYTEEKILSMTHDEDGRADWLLRNCPVPQRAKKLRLAKEAHDAYCKRRDRDTMLYEDDRSFLYQQIYDTNMRTLDYERYVFLCGLFGPMSVEDWALSGSQPGTKYWIRATVAVTKIQHAWDRYWSTYKLHRYLAARAIQTAYRCHWGWKNLHPIVLIRQKIGKRTYYFFCWAAWTDYNFRVRRIAFLLDFHKYNWLHQTFDSWVKYVELVTVEKKATLAKFRRRFDTRMNSIHRWRTYVDKSLRLKCLLRNMYYIPQFQMWVEAVRAIKRERELGEVVTPVQSWFRMRSQFKYFQKLQEKKWVFLRLGYMLKGRAKVTRERNKHIADTMMSWGPRELERRRLENLEIERRRQIRENQLANEKAMNCVRELQRHFKTWKGKVQLREEAAAMGNTKKDKTAYELLKRCYVINYEQSKHEYRIKTGPHVICADPLCHQIFASDDAYVQHVRDIMEAKEQHKVPKGVLKEDVFTTLAEDALLEVVNYVDEKKRKEMKDSAVRAKLARQERIRQQKIAPEVDLDSVQQPDRSKSVLGVKKDLTDKKPKRSAAEKYAEKKRLEEEKKEKEDAIAEEERQKEEQEKKDKKKAKRERAKERRRASVVGSGGGKGGGLPGLDGLQIGEDGKVTAITNTNTTAAGDNTATSAADGTDSCSKANSPKGGKNKDINKSTDDATSTAGDGSTSDSANGGGRGGGDESGVLSAEAADHEAEIASNIEHEGIRHHIVFPSSNFARFHLLIRHPRGVAAVRNYLSRKHGVCPLVNTLDCWEAIQMWRLGSTASFNEPYIVRALLIYDQFLAPGCPRPVEIVLADGNILSNAYHRAQKAGHGSMADMLHFNHHEQEEEHWWQDMEQKLLQVRDREYVGFYGNGRARPSTLRKVFGLRGQTYLQWSDKRTLRPDVFDPLEWACFQTVYRNIYYFDSISQIDREKNAAIDGLVGSVEDKKQRELARQKKEMLLNTERKKARLQREKEYLVTMAFKRRRELWLDAHGWDLDGWAELVEKEKKEAAAAAAKAESESETAPAAANTGSSDDSASAVEAVDAAAVETALPVPVAVAVTANASAPPSIPAAADAADAAAKDEKEKEKSDDKVVDSESLPPFYSSREHAKFVEAKKVEEERQTAALINDYAMDRKKRILNWARDHKVEEMEISRLAQQVVEINWEKEVCRLADKAANAWARERIIDYSEIEQKPHELTQAIADDAVSWSEEKELDHMFDFYGNKLLEEMLTHEEMVEGMMEYAGFLKGKKQLKKHLKIEVQAVGVREDLSWLKNCLKDAIAEDMAHLPLDYIGCVRLVQRRIRGWLGRTKARRRFSTVFLKKFDASTNQVYYVNGMMDPPEVTWERPKFMHHLWPGTRW